MGTLTKFFSLSTVSLFITVSPSIILLKPSVPKSISLSQYFPRIAIMSRELHFLPRWKRKYFLTSISAWENTTTKVACKICCALIFNFVLAWDFCLSELHVERNPRPRKLELWLKPQAVFASCQFSEDPWGWRVVKIFCIVKQIVQIVSRVISWWYVLLCTVLFPKYS